MAEKSGWDRTGAGVAAADSNGAKVAAMGGAGATGAGCDDAAGSDSVLRSIDSMSRDGISEPKASLVRGAGAATAGAVAGAGSAMD